MGERQPTVSRFSFNRSIFLAGTDEDLSSSAGLLVVRELDERWRIIDRLAEMLVDDRCEGRIKWSMESLLRARLFAMVAGYSFQRDVALLTSDPVMCLTTSDRKGCSPLLESAQPSQPTLARMHRQLGCLENRRALSNSVFDLAVRVIRDVAKASASPHTIDIDAMPIPVHGEQPGSTWNGYYGERCYNPLMAVHGETGTMLAADLRSGATPSAKEAISFLMPIIARLEHDLGSKVRVRGDSGFANRKLLDALDERGTRYVFRMASNSRLDKIAELQLETSSGPRPSELRETLHSLKYWSKRWQNVRRIILVVREQPGQLFSERFYLVTNDWRSSPRTILEHYRQRGTSESRFGELKSRLEPKLSCTSTKGKREREMAWHANEGTFQLYMLADGMLHALRWLAPTQLSSDGESMPRLQRVQRFLIDVAARVTRSARRMHVHIAETANAVWLPVLARLNRLRPVT